MARLNDLGQGKLEAPKIDPRLVIVRPGHNYRNTSSQASRAHIEWLKGSIKERGVDDAIWVEYEGGKVFLIDGECRLMALRELWNEGYEIRVPAIAYRGDEAAVLEKSMVANGGLPPTQLEFGKAAERLLAWGRTPEQIAALTPPHLGLAGPKAVRYVREAVELQQAPLAVKKAVADGTVTEALALSVTKKNRLMAPQIIEKAAEEAKAAGKSKATRPKGAGKVAKAKAFAAEKIQTLEDIGDQMADVLMSSAGTAALAKKWNQLRGR